ncbi:MAG: hypothetical protein JWN04_3860 [Myxococcaceae bacterium]|nr:hypothetical protein [Myxococcaceae bacterium]
MSHDVPESAMTRVAGEFGARDVAWAASRTRAPTCPDGAKQETTSFRGRSIVDRAEQLELYKLSWAEYRAEVTLGWSRARSFLALGMVGPLAVVAAPSTRALAATTCISSFAMVASMLGVLVVRQSHQRYRATRQQLDTLSRELGIPGFETTGGMRQAHGKPRGGGVRVSNVMMLLLALLAVLNATLVLLPR